MSSLISRASSEVPGSLRYRKSQPADLGRPEIRWRSPGNPLGRAFLTLFLATAGRLVLWQQRLEDREALRRMPDRMRRDIGLDAAAAQAEANKPFWRA
jgi:uncharacterized protein YjiS (DUF1127 family)